MGNLSWGNFNANTSLNQISTTRIWPIDLGWRDAMNKMATLIVRASGRSATTMLANSGPLTAKTGASASGFQEIASTKFESGMSHSIAARDTSVAAMQRHDWYRVLTIGKKTSVPTGGTVGTLLQRMAYRWYFKRTNLYRSSRTRFLEPSNVPSKRRYRRWWWRWRGLPCQRVHTMDTVKAMYRRSTRQGALNDEAGVKSTTSDLVDFATKYGFAWLGDHVNGGNSRRSDVSASLLCQRTLLMLRHYLSGSKNIF